MLLALEICLAIAAWQRGWKGWALLPPGIAFGIGFLAGLIMGASGASEGSIFAVGLVADVICIGALIAMVIKPRKKNQYLESEQASETTGVDIHER
jgi:hypothetical protein